MLTLRAPYGILFFACFSHVHRFRFYKPVFQSFEDSRISNSHKLLLSLPSGEPNIIEVTDFLLMLYIIGH